LVYSEKSAQDLYNGFMQERLRREQEEKKHKIEKNAEAYLYTIVKVFLAFFPRYSYCLFL
jgi:hypothetical protein